METIVLSVVLAIIIYFLTVIYERLWCITNILKDLIGIYRRDIDERNRRDEDLFL